VDSRLKNGYLLHNRGAASRAKWNIVSNCTRKLWVPVPALKWTCGELDFLSSSRFVGNQHFSFTVRLHNIHWVCLINSCQLHCPLPSTPSPPYTYTFVLLINVGRLGIALPCSPSLPTPYGGSRLRSTCAICWRISNTTRNTWTAALVCTTHTANRMPKPTWPSDRGGGGFAWQYIRCRGVVPRGCSCGRRPLVLSSEQALWACSEPTGSTREQSLPTPVLSAAGWAFRFHASRVYYFASI